MTGSQQRTRRAFLRGLLYLPALPGFWLLRRFQQRSTALPECASPRLVIPYTPAAGIRFHDQVILVTTAKGLSVFSSACPHLGCRIDRTDGGQLVCPCHGSRFNDDGEVVRNPAARGLRRLKYEHDVTRGLLRIFLEPT